MMHKLQTLLRLGPRRLRKLSRGYRLAWMGAIQGYFTTRTVQALLNVGLFDQMQSTTRVNLDAFAQDHGLDADILAALCNSLYARRLLDRDQRTYWLTSKGRTLVEVGRGWFNGVYGYGEIYDRLEDLLQQKAVYGREVNRRPLITARGACEAESWVHFPVAIQQIRREGWRRVLDLGCGDGTFLRQLCNEVDGTSGFGIDHDPAVLAEAQAATKEAGLTGRIELNDADLTRLDTAPDHFLEVDVVTSFLVLHELLWDGPDTVIEALRNIRTLLPGIPLLIVEVIRPTDQAMRRRPGMMVHYLVQHELSHQRLIDRTQWREIFAAAGFADVEETYFDFARMSVFTLR